MKKNSKTIAILLGLALSAALPLAVQAQATAPGIYAGVALGQSEALEYECDALEAAGGECKKKGTAFKIFGGYQFHRNFAVEVAFFDLGKVSSNVPGTFDEVIKVKGSEATLVAQYPATERFSIYGKAGIYYAHTSDDFTQSGTRRTLKEGNWNGTFGAGLQIFVWENLALRLEGQRWMKVAGGSIGDSDYNAYTAGLLWKFR
jgi:OmpA-OmpF porin, OOP family